LLNYITDRGSITDAEGQPDVPAALGAYRYISWLGTSILYFSSLPASTIPYKLVVVGALLAAAYLAHGLYLRAQARANPGQLRFLVYGEALGIALLLLPTGGLENPFLWYALNPVLIAAVELSFLWAWGVLVAFLVAALAPTAVWTGSVSGTVEALASRGQLILIFFLFSTAARLLADLMRRTREHNRVLERQRQSLERALDTISSLYSLVERLTVHDRREDVLALFAATAEELTDVSASFVLAGSPADVEAWIIEGELSAADELEAVVTELVLHRGPAGRADTPLGRMLWRPIEASNSRHGYLGLVYTGSTVAGSFNSRRLLDFLAQLAAVSLEQLESDRLGQQLLLQEEQNRIADELHDGVAQQLFNIACACHALKERWNTFSEEQIESQLDLVASTTQEAAKDLRASIYSLSSKRQGEEVFVPAVRGYLEELSELNGVEVDFHASGSEEVLSAALRRSFFRIIREAVGNAVRHGKAATVVVNMQLSPSRSSLTIKDNGYGFAVQQHTGKGNGGLGLRNMSQLMEGFGGECIVESEQGRGTTVACYVPARTEHELGEEASSYAYRGN
jgi:NarL family two-component system sensor histidine kinase LiaS